MVIINEIGTTGDEVAGELYRLVFQFSVFANSNDDAKDDAGSAAESGGGGDLVATPWVPARCNLRGRAAEMNRMCLSAKDVPEAESEMGSEA